MVEFLICVVIYMYLMGIINLWIMTTESMKNILLWPIMPILMWIAIKLMSK